ncbi:MAG TPA: hypothetical protein DCE56_38630 [Cyanobacteria bacterium UBA8553]|nr:hypothetical protein [Cyanobacteria bacterium UBA8553]HAJ64642.1 hypothetical protein [Cyanobacteria bacterium UBA8543]
MNRHKPAGIPTPDSRLPTPDSRLPWVSPGSDRLSYPSAAVNFPLRQFILQTRDLVTDDSSENRHDKAGNDGNYHYLSGRAGLLHIGFR